MWQRSLLCRSLTNNNRIQYNKNNIINRITTVTAATATTTTNINNPTTNTTTAFYSTTHSPVTVGVPTRTSINSAHNFDYNPNSIGARIGELVLTTKHGVDVLLDPLLNKGTGFPLEERERLSIRGLVPPRLPGRARDALQWQVKRIMSRFDELPTPLVKYSYMQSLQDRNEVLFYRCLVDHLELLAPIIYTPTVGAACVNFATLFRRPRGMYFSAADRDQMHSMVFNWPTDDVEIIVVTDGSRILGLGDLGCNGMGISIGKLALYTAGAGIHPSKCLPVVIDVGTNNNTLLQDTMYLGLQHRRLTGDSYMAIVDEFIRAVRERFPRVLIQFEDFSNENAGKLLEKYRNKILCFNDDIQGTGTVALAGVLGALRAAGYKDPVKALTEQRIIIAGAGSAGIGVASALLFAMKQVGLSEVEAHQRFWLLDHRGSLGSGRQVDNPLQLPWIRTDIPDQLTLEELVELVKPTILLGLSGTAGVFTEKSIKIMSQYCDRPIIFPLSNPTDKAECRAKEAYEWSDGRCIFASGSPFDPVQYKGKLFKPGQANNMYCFPGIGLGALTVQAKSISDTMLYAAGRALAASVSESDLNDGRIFPHVHEIPRVSKLIAVAVAEQAYSEGLATIPIMTEQQLAQAIEDRFWEPNYGSMVRVNVV